MKIVFDMETQDPDDYLTLLLLLGHPRVELAAVTITPGTPWQVGLVRATLKTFGREDVRVGAYDIEHPKNCVSPWHERVYGEITPSIDAYDGARLLYEVCDEDTTLVTGAPLKNLGGAVAMEGFTLGRWVAQGGFAGEGVVAPEAQLSKFKGRVTCPTYNFNGAPRAAFAALAGEGISARRFVSKNVCHGVIYDAELHAIVGSRRAGHPHLEAIWMGMEAYLRKKPQGKKFHDPLAACCALDEEIGEWAEVELFRERGDWGSRLSPGSGTWIITGYDPERFVSVLTET